MGGSGGLKQQIDVLENERKSLQEEIVAQANILVTFRGLLVISKCCTRFF